MNDQIVIAVLAGTTRKERQSIKAAHYIAEIGSHIDNVEIIFVDPSKFSFPYDGNDPEGKDQRYSAITAKADAFFILTPEYNHSFPGSLKRMLDSELENYIHKPVAIAGASSGNWGGVRAVEALVGSVREMGLVATSYSPYFPHVQDMFDDDNQLLPSYEVKTRKSVQLAYDELIWFARALTNARKK